MHHLEAEASFQRTLNGIENREAGTDDAVELIMLQ